MSAYDDLRRALDDLGDQLTPCQGPNRDRWISDDAEDREWSAHHCQPCPIREACLAASLEIKATAAVWGGIDRTPTTRAKKAS